MKHNTDQEELMVRYLLEKVAEEEQSEIEERFFSDNDYFEQLLALEDDLIDSYVQGKLPKDEQEQVERLLMSSPRQRQDMEFTKSLVEDLTAVRSQEAADTHPTGVNSTSWWKSLLNLSSPGRKGWKPAFAVLGIAALLFVSLLAWSIVLRNNVARLEAERASLEKKERELQEQLVNQSNNNQKLAEELKREQNMRANAERELAELIKPAPPLSSSKPLSIFLTIDSISRGSSDLKKAILPRGNRPLNFYIELDEKDDYKQYRGTIKTFGGKQIWEGKIIERAGPASLILKLRTNRFSTDDYTLTLSGEVEQDNWEVIREYTFLIRK